MRISKQELQRWDDIVKWVKSSAPPERGESAHGRKERVLHLLNNWEEFMRYYFPRWVSSDFAPFHKRGLNAVLNNKEKKFIFSWKIARNMSKTTLWQMFAIFLNMRKVNGLPVGYETGILFSKSYDAAAELLRPIRAQYEANPRIVNDFGEQKSFGNWDDSKFVLSSGPSWRSLGKGQSPRGTKEEEKRPDFILGDDFDDDEEVRNITRLDNSWDWMMGALFGTFDVSASHLFVGLNNRIAKDCLIERLCSIADFTDTVNLLDKQGRPTWNRFTKKDCEYMIEKMGTRLAQREYFNNPINEGKVFKAEWMQEKKMHHLKDYQVIVAYLDPSFKSRKNADHKALIMIGMKAGEIHIIKVWCAQATVGDMIAWHYECFEYLQQRAGAAEFWMEEVFLQDLLYNDFNQEAVKRGYPIPVRGDKRKKPDKDARIEAMSGYFERGQVYFNEAEKNNHHMQRLKEQLLLFEMGRTGVKKDGPDALEGAIIKASDSIRIAQPPAVGYRKRFNKKHVY